MRLLLIEPHLGLREVRHHPLLRRSRNDLPSVLVAFSMNSCSCRPAVCRALGLFCFLVEPIRRARQYLSFLFLVLIPLPPHLVVSAI